MSKTDTEAGLKPVYLIVSEQKLLVDQAVERLRKRFAEAGDISMDLQIFSAEKASADEILIACNTLPLASEHRLVIVRDIEKLGREALEALAAYASDPSPMTVLALAGEKLAKNTKLYKAVDRNGEVLARQLDKRDVPDFVAWLFRQRGKAVDGEAVTQLIASVGYDLQKLSAEIDKAVAYVGERDTVACKDVAAVTVAAAPTRVWEFAEALGDRDCRRALQRVAALVEEGESVHGLHALAIRTIRDLIAARALLDRGVGGSAAIAQQMGRQEWQVRRLVRQAKGFGRDELAGLLTAAAETETQMKTSRDARLALERWIVKVCG